MKRFDLKNRRDFMKVLGIGALGVAYSPVLKAATIPRVVIVGGGFAGSTCAKYLKLWGGSSVSVTIVEEDPNYISPILSNLVLNSQKSIADLTFSYEPHKNNYMINVINQKVTAIDKTNKYIKLADGSTLEYDKLVLAPGIDFIKTNDYDFSKVPHAWIAGEQTVILKEKIDLIKSGETFLMSIPSKPYRCPPGPYERACVVADYLKNIKGIDAKVVVLDENPDIVVEKENFQTAFNKLGIEYIPNAKVTKVDDTNMQVEYLESGSLKTKSAKVLNIIPNQKAAAIVLDNGLGDASGFAPVNLLSYESTIAKDIHIIGDSHKSSQPKAGHIANSEAKVCADAILRSLNGYEPYPNPKTNSACYSPISSKEATWLTAVYRYDGTTNNMVLVNGSFAAGTPSTSNYKKMFMWSGNLFADTFK